MLGNWQAPTHVLSCVSHLVLAGSFDYLSPLFTPDMSLRREVQKCSPVALHFAWGCISPGQLKTGLVLSHLILGICCCC